MVRGFRVRKTGTGTLEDPIRPDERPHTPMKELHDVLDDLRARGLEVRNKTFYVMRVVEYTDDEVEIEIEEPIKTIEEWTSELSR